ncbi:hypothetical protein T11_9218 [Trichinella zimbabwensis]|uniref:Uncharacterized protein n=1 Tax=Trichinella zimbabwensis TaxID=268475 RepID=A0A0V1I8S2_9BILA|nr:hypothetical protein T11_9218 [Trichinella zimbabwensis]
MLKWFCTTCNMFCGNCFCFVDKIFDGSFTSTRSLICICTTVFFACFLSYQIYDLMYNIAPKILSEQKKYEDEFLREIPDENGESGSLVQSN